MGAVPAEPVRLLDEGAPRPDTTTRPWKLAKAEQKGDHEATAKLDHVLTTLLDACHALARELQPFLPAAATRLARALTVVDCLYIAVAQRNLRRARKAVEETRDAVSSHRVS